MTSSAPEIDPTALIAPTAVIGSPYRPLFDGEWDRLGRPTSIGAGCDVGHFCVVGEEAEIGASSVLDTYTLVEPGATVGCRTFVTYRASICVKATVGDDCVIGALISERSRVGNGCRIFGDLVHRQIDPSRPWDSDSSQELSPTVRDGAFVGWGASIIGPIVVGRGSYVCAGATVTRSVPDGMIVRGVNELIRPEDWSGELGESKYFSPMPDAGVDQPRDLVPTTS